MTPVDAGQLQSAAAAKYDHADNSIFEKTENACAALLTNVVQSGSELITAVPVPTFDDNKNPGSLAFPFVVGKRLFSVDRPWLSADDHRPLLVRYYRLAVSCTSPAPDQFRVDMHRWLDSVVVPLLADRNRWFPVLAGATSVVRDAAKAASVDVTAVDLPKRKVTANTTTGLTVANDEGGDDDIRRSCDDGTDGQVPNANVSLSVILLSLMSTWLSFWAFGFERKSQTVTNFQLIRLTGDGKRVFPTMFLISRHNLCGPRLGRRSLLRTARGTTCCGAAISGTTTLSSQRCMRPTGTVQALETSSR